MAKSSVPVSNILIKKSGSFRRSPGRPLAVPGGFRRCPGGARGCRGNGRGCRRNGRGWNLPPKRCHQGSRGVPRAPQAVPRESQRGPKGDPHGSQTGPNWVLGPVVIDPGVSWELLRLSIFTLSARMCPLAFSVHRSDFAKRSTRFGVVGERGSRPKIVGLSPWVS